MIPLPPATVPFFIGTYGPGIYRATLNPATGAISAPALATAPAGSPDAARDPSFIAPSPDGRAIYATLESSGEVAAFVVRGERLELLNRRPSLGAAPCHVSVTPDGKAVLAANYGGSVAGFSVRPDGGLGAPFLAFRNAGDGPDRARQTGPHPHSIVPSPDGHFAYACDLGTDEVLAARLEPPAALVTGTSAEPETAARGFAPMEPRAKVPAGAGPRHLAFGPPSTGGAGFVYVVNEMGLSITAFAREAKSGALRRLGTVPMLPTDTFPAERVRAGASGAEIAVSPNGRFVYASVRGADLIAAFRIARDGSLTPLGAFPAGVRTPRGFAIAPVGRWLIVAGQDSNDLRALRLDPRTGRLGSPGASVSLSAKPVSVAFLCR